MKGPRLKLLGRPIVELRRPAGEVIALNESRWYGALSICGNATSIGTYLRGARFRARPATHLQPHALRD